MLKKLILLALLINLVSNVQAQESTSTTNVLTLPVSSRVAALGGSNISVVDDNPALGLHNPALLANVSHRTIALDFMTYAPGTMLMGAQYSHHFGERHTTSFFTRYMNYGSMQETTDEGHSIGTFHPMDLYFGAGYSYLLSDRWSGGANLKFDYSQIADFRAFALAVDVGINYYDPDKDLSISMVARNIGAQISHFNDRTERMPFSLKAGLSAGLGNSPLRLHLTAVDLTRWSGRQYVTTRETGKVSWGTNLLNHFVVGVDYVPFNELFWVGIGYNFRRGYELSGAGISKLAGFNAGAGVHIKKFSLGVSYSIYHRAYSSFMGNISYTL